MGCEDVDWIHLWLLWTHFTKTQGNKVIKDKKQKKIRNKEPSLVNTGTSWRTQSDYASNGACGARNPEK